VASKEATDSPRHSTSVFAKKWVFPAIVRRSKTTVMGSDLRVTTDCEVNGKSPSQRQNTGHSRRVPFHFSFLGAI
jgi:hypothetical protein